MSRVEPNQREIVGYSFTDDAKKSAWIDLVHSIAKWVEDNNLSNEVIFHGTSNTRADDILENGMVPTDIIHAIAAGSFNDAGSFWGDIHTAAAYAEDTVAERDPGSEPVILMANVPDLEAEFQLLPDLATLDFPMKGLTKLDDQAVYDNWINNHRTLAWQQSLAELGAIIAVHDEPLPPAYIQDIRTKADFEAMFHSKQVIESAVLSACL